MKRPLACLAAALCLPSLASAQAWRAYFPASTVVMAAATTAACEVDAPVMIEGTQGYADSLDGGKCFVSIDPEAAPGMIYRDYAFFWDGMMMVFNSYGPAEGPTMTSAREYYFFPRATALHLAMSPLAKTITVAMANGGRAVFDPATAQISALDRGTVKVSASLDRSARGGVEIPDYQGLMLDAGFRLGELPSGLPNGASTFRDARGKTCAVTNSEIFVYTAGGDNSFKYDDAGLSKFLKTRCPALHVGF